ncbi:MAG: DUF2480 family protein [Chitinophagales bacterium]|nr:DUF2480 family protein [Chitinophagales bacterium]
MDTTKPILNKVAQSGLVTIDLEEYFPLEKDIAVVDLKNYLFKELILKEADFREAVKSTDWSMYSNKYVALYCSANAVVPMWAYMLLSVALTPYAKDIACTHPSHAAEIFLYRNIAAINLNEFEGKRIVVKGCGERQIPEAAYVQIAQQLSRVARSVMYGEACSSVPVFKKSVG